MEQETALRKAVLPLMQGRTSSFGTHLRTAAETEGGTAGTHALLLDLGGPAEGPVPLRLPGGARRSWALALGGRLSRREAGEISIADGSKSMLRQNLQSQRPQEGRKETP